MPQTIDRYFADNRNGKRMDELTDVLPHQRSAHQDAPILIHDDLRVALVAVGHDLRAGDVAQVVLYRSNAQSGLAGLRFCESDGSSFGIGKKHLRNG